MSIHANCNVVLVNETGIQHSCKFLYHIFRYFKRFDIPDMERAQLKLDQGAISVAHANNTLIITVSQQIGFFCLFSVS